MNGMTPDQYAEAVAGEVRAEMGRQGKTKTELAEALGITTSTASTRLKGAQPFDVLELATVAAWLDVPIENFAPTTTERVAAS